MENNITVTTDSYKMCHWEQYPASTEFVYSYFESRSGAKYNNTVFFGLQYLLKRYMTGPVVTQYAIDKAAELCRAHFGTDKHFNQPMWQHILDKHGGWLPLFIKAVPEGTPVPVSNVLMSIVNTDPKCAALTNHMETLLSQVWAPSTVATLSYEILKLITHYRQETSDNLDGVKFGLHDFGFRGVSSVESAGLLGAGHLLNFLGTDTLAAMGIANQYYGAPLDGLAYSVPATEHSVMTARGEAGEEEVFLQLLDRYPEGILSVVIDSYDYRRFIQMTAKHKDRILARPGKLVYRPDSGDPTSVTVDIYNMLATIYGTTTNQKGYQELHPKVGVLWGDGIDYAGIRSILFSLRNNRYSTASMVFGMGGGLLQKINRDDQRFAFKSSAQCRDGVWYDIRKKPIDVSKVSKKGVLRLVNRDGIYITESKSPDDRDIADPEDVMVPVFMNGSLLCEHGFADVRKRTGTW